MKIFFQVTDRGEPLANLVHQVRVPGGIAIEGPGQVWGCWAGGLRICGRLFPVGWLEIVDAEWRMAEMTPESAAALMETLQASGWLCQSATPDLYHQWQAGAIDPAALAVV